jgi:hypothetical protein
MIIVKTRELHLGKNELLLSPDAAVLGVQYWSSRGVVVFADHQTPERETLQTYRVVRTGEAVPLGAPYVGSYSDCHHLFGPCP